MTITLSNPSVLKYMDEDESQEFYCLILEGFSEKEAASMARSANDKINSRRLSGPITGDTKNGHGKRPMISDMTISDMWTDTVSITQDFRTDEEREDDWSTEVPDISAVLTWLTPRQREFVSHKFGLGGIEAARSEQELADRLGVKKNTVNSAMKKVRKKVKEVLALGGYEEWERQVRANRAQGGARGRAVRYAR